MAEEGSSWVKYVVVGVIVLVAIVLVLGLLGIIDLSQLKGAIGGGVGVIAPAPAPAPVAAPGIPGVPNEALAAVLAAILIIALLAAWKKGWLKWPWKKKEKVQKIRILKEGAPIDVSAGVPAQLYTKKTGPFRAVHKISAKLLPPRVENALKPLFGKERVIFLSPKLAHHERSYGTPMGMNYNGVFKTIKISGAAVYKNEKLKAQLRDDYVYIPSWLDDRFKGLPEGVCYLFPTYERLRSISDLDFVIVTTIAKTEELDGITSLLDAARTYFENAGIKYKFVIVDISEGNECKKIIEETEEDFGDIDIIEGETHIGRIRAKYGSRKKDYLTDDVARGTDMYFTFSQGFKYALENFKFKYCLKVDSNDTLITGSFKLLEGLDSVFTGQVGAAGCFNKKCKIETREKDDYGYEIYTDSDKDGYYWNPIIEEIRKSDSDYSPIDHLQGGGYIITRRCLEDLNAKGLLGKTEIEGLWGHEDWVISILIRYAGYRIGNICSPRGPFAIKWQEIPFGFRALRSRNFPKTVCVIHPLKSKLAKEKGVRAFFREERRKHNLKIYPPK